ncbi:type III secretion system cytoplasmic ring protein SctQ [Burkholderia singularis]|uniref:Type III secretion inner membrane protein (YscQ,homologous to flagellar export components) n=1 Tax=Burkholderia singularis TaxID=1503053 RepID=A0A238H3T7_9BURK|nr:type III secretion system cytoplasmic ring protein SctQ [Burkholderia singularis]SMF99954.1 Type III secretion inner membrane protein (YscQ,homologous to flagellar export components) [Burkholderia singularis]
MPIESPIETVQSAEFESLPRFSKIIDAEHRPLNLPAIDSSMANITRILCNQRLIAYIEARGEIAHLSIEPLDRLPEWQHPALARLSFSVQSSELTVSVGFDLDAYPVLAAAVGTDEPPYETAATPRAGTAGAPQQAMPNAQSARSDLRQALARALLEPMLTLLAPCGLNHPRVHAIRRQAPAGEHDHRSLLRLSCRALGRSHEFVLHIDKTIQALERLAPPLSAARLGSLRLPGRLIIGVKPLAYDTLRALAPGDVILRALHPSLNAKLLDASGAPRASVFATAAWGAPRCVRLCAAVEFDRQSLVLIKEPVMSDASESDLTGSADELIHIGELEVPVQFEVDIVKLSLTQLASLRSGYVIELETSVDKAQLRLVAHGQTIGYGEMVTVGEHLGVRILRMASEYVSTD